MTGTTIANYGSAAGAGTMHFEDEVGFPAMPKHAFSGNTFVWKSGYMETHFPFGICFRPEALAGEDGPIGDAMQTWKAKVASTNQLVEARTQTKSYVFKIPKPDGGHELLTSGSRYTHGSVARPVTISADENTTCSYLLAALALQTDKVEHALDSAKEPAPWLFLAASPDGTQSHPMTTLGELPDFEKHQLTGYGAGIANVLYLVDRRDAAEDPMVIEE